MQGISFKRDDSKVVIESELRRLKTLKQSADQANALYKDAHESVMKHLEALGRKTYVVDDIKATVVKGTTVSYDEKGLAKALGAAMWNKVTKKTLDRAKLEEKVERGEIDINVIAQHSSVNEKAPYLRLSAVLESEDG